MRMSTMTVSSVVSGQGHIRSYDRPYTTGNRAARGVGARPCTDSVPSETTPHHDARSPASCRRGHVSAARSKAIYKSQTCTPLSSRSSTRLPSHVPFVFCCTARLAPNGALFELTAAPRGRGSHSVTPPHLHKWRVAVMPATPQYTPITFVCTSAHRRRTRARAECVRAHVTCVAVLHMSSPPSSDDEGGFLSA